MTHPDIKIPEVGPIVSFNEGNYYGFDQPVRDYLEETKKKGVFVASENPTNGESRGIWGEVAVAKEMKEKRDKHADQELSKPDEEFGVPRVSPPAKEKLEVKEKFMKPRNRNVGALVADAHNVLINGGIYGYPATTSNANGKLRLIYECNPMAMILEAAGGYASTGRGRILEVEPTEVHQRIPTFLGSKDCVSRLEGFYTKHDEEVMKKALDSENKRRSEVGGEDLIGG